VTVETLNPEQTATDVQATGAGRVSVIWGRVVLGFILSTTGGAAFGHAWTVQATTWWWLGAVSALAGALLLLSAAYVRR
jgi:hypothetical protein